MRRIGVDIGGTFTDIVYIDDETNEVVNEKVRSTPKDPSIGVLKGLESARLNMLGVALLVHGTTVGTNAIVQRKGAKVGLITTKGFRDVLEITRGDRKELYNWRWKKPQPLVPRNLRLEVAERTNYLGQILTPLDKNDVEKAVGKLRASGVEAIAVCFLNSYVNPENEEKAEAFIKAIWTEVPVSISSKIAREYREYERTSTTVLDAYIKKIVVNYLNRLDSGLKKMKFDGQLLITCPNGVVGIQAVAENSLSTAASGPIGGAAGSAYLAKALKTDNLFTMDVGGTTFDVAVIKDGSGLEKFESQILGYPVLIRGVDIRSIGAGGGSIAKLDAGGLLHVGPESAGAEPGPMCYGLGGTRPTVTDAALVNGLLDPDYFLGGSIKLNKELATKGVSELAGLLKLDLNETAEGILKIARNNMSSTAREILVGQGLDPRDFTILAFGGGGGLFAGDIAKDLGIPKIVIPPVPGNFCAWGMLTMDIVHTYVEGHIRLDKELNMADVQSMYEEMEKKAIERLRQEKVTDDAIQMIRSMDMCYRGQGHYVSVPVPNGRLSEDTKHEILETFHKLHEIRYGFRMDQIELKDTPVKCVNLRIKATGKVKEVPFKHPSRGKTIPQPALKSKRKVYLGGGFVMLPIYERDRLLSGNIIPGPAIIEEPTHTTLVMPEHILNIDKYGNLVITVK